MNIQTQIELILFGLLDIAGIGWIVWYCVRNGTAPSSWAALVYRDRNPIRFWTSIAGFVLIGGMMLATVVWQFAVGGR
jgi:hypothetical protein